VGGFGFGPQGVKFADQKLFFLGVDGWFTPPKSFLVNHGVPDLVVWDTGGLFGCGLGRVCAVCLGVFSLLVLFLVGPRGGGRVLGAPVGTRFFWGGVRFWFCSLGGRTPNNGLFLPRTQTRPKWGFVFVPSFFGNGGQA